MRIRSIRPEFWRSEDVAELDWHARLLFVGLWSYVDDNGVGLDRDPTIAADLFADDLSRDPRETLARVTDGLAALAARSMITRYTVDGKRYLFVTNFSTHQKVDRPGKSRYPLPTCGNAEIRETLATPSRGSRETVATGEGEKGRRGEGEKKTTASAVVPTRPDVEALCEHLADRIEANGSARPTITKRWRDATRLMLDSDGRSVDDVRAAIDWCQDDEFWRSNVMSMPKLRHRYDQLRLQAQRSHARPTSDRQGQILTAELARARAADAAGADVFAQIGAAS